MSRLFIALTFFGYSVWCMALPGDREFMHAITAFEFSAYELGGQLLSESADAGHPGAQFMLGSLYREGKYLRKRPTRAIYWLSRSAATGNPLAEFELAEMMFLGEGGFLDRGQAHSMFLNLLAHGYPEVFYYLGVSHFIGDQVPIDYEVARKYLTIAAKLGVVEAQHALYLLEKLLLGIDSEDADGVKWLQRAAASGYRPALISLVIVARELGLAEKEREYLSSVIALAQEGWKPAMQFLQPRAALL